MAVLARDMETMLKRLEDANLNNERIAKKVQNLEQERDALKVSSCLACSEDSRC